jgi:hypothetical protein
MGFPSSRFRLEMADWAGSARLTRWPIRVLWMWFLQRGRRKMRLLYGLQPLSEFIFGQLQSSRRLFFITIALAQRLEQHNPLDLG